MDVKGENRGDICRTAGSVDRSLGGGKRSAEERIAVDHVRTEGERAGGGQLGDVVLSFVGNKRVVDVNKTSALHHHVAPVMGGVTGVVDMVAVEDRVADVGSALRHGKPGSRRG